MRYGAWLGRGGLHPYIAASTTGGGGPSGGLAWLLALIIGVIGAIVWTIL